MRTAPHTARADDCDLVFPTCRVALGDSELRLREAPSTEHRQVAPRLAYGALLGGSQPMRRMFEVLERLSQSDATVLIQGESGTGKELVATEIVNRGLRKDRPLVVVDCGAISMGVIESELFGHARGAFTGAHQARVGAFEAADGGTIFLDEIGELPLQMQPKLLRVLEAGEVRRVGRIGSREATRPARPTRPRVAGPDHERQANLGPQARAFRRAEHAPPRSVGRTPT